MEHSCIRLQVHFINLMSNGYNITATPDKMGDLPVIRGYGASFPSSNETQLERTQVSETSLVNSGLGVIPVSTRQVRIPKVEW